jgi:anti-anti-sigma factor
VPDDLHQPTVRSVEARGDAVVVHLRGELDLYSAEELRAALANAIASAPSRIVVEMSDVAFMDSTAFSVLLEARSKLGDTGELLLAGPQIDTRRALQVSGLDRRLPVHASVDEALAAR